MQLELCVMATRWCDSLKNRNQRCQSSTVQTVLTTLWLFLMSSVAMMTCKRPTWAAGLGGEVKSALVWRCSGGLGHVADSETSNISHLQEPILISTLKMKANCSWSFSKTCVQCSILYITPLYCLLIFAMLFFGLRLVCLVGLDNTYSVIKRNRRSSPLST